MSYKGTDWELGEQFLITSMNEWQIYSWLNFS